jgi:hypothetical protein
MPYSQQFDSGSDGDQPNRSSVSDLSSMPAVFWLKNLRPATLLFGRT